MIKIVYRIRQLWLVIFPTISEEEKQWLLKVLPPQGYKLFLRQPPAEQRHGIDVARYLSAHACLDKNRMKVLLIAALLHDCGKSFVKVRLWQRILIVLIQNLPDSLITKLQAIRFISDSLIIATEHAAWGYKLTCEAGLSEDICRLVLRHHTPETEIEFLLYDADNLH